MTLRNPDNNPNENQDNRPPTRWLTNRWVLGLLLVALIAINVRTFQPGPPTIHLPYSILLEEVRNGNVDKLEIEGLEIRGQFEEPSIAPVGAEVSGGWPLVSPPAKYEHFKTNVPAIGDDRLLPLLEENDVQITSVSQKPPLLLSLLFTFGPTLLLVGLIVYFLRLQKRDQQGMFNFGRSRAKTHSLSHPSVRFTDVAGAEEAKFELVEVVDFLKTPDRYKQLGARIPRGVLLVGPPGTGKTLLARAVAGEAGVPFFSTSASEFVEMFVGIGASRVRDMFNQARRNAPAIIFIDELDAIGRQRGAGMGGGHDEREQTLNQILVEMDGFEESVNVIIIAATNRADVLDPALMRPGRFDRQVTVDLPDVRGREAILKIHLGGKPLAADVDPAVLAKQTPGFAGANLANLVNEAALHAARDQQQHVAMRHFNEALDKIMLGTERPLLMTDHDRSVIAYHEAGHALVALKLPESDPVNKVTIIPRGRALGVTEYLPEGDRFNYSRQYLLTQLAVALGGRVAEEIAIGDITTGAENDLQRATQLARRMIGHWGMTEELGLLFVGENQQSPFLGREMGSHGSGPRDYSEATAALVDDIARKLLEERRTTALSILSENRILLDRLAQALLKYETLDKECINAALRGDEIPPPAKPSFPDSPPDSQGGQAERVLKPRAGGIQA
jgi:cell division protease FtsH